MKDNGFAGFNYKRNEKVAAKVRGFRKQMIQLGIDYAEFDGTDTEYEDVKLARKGIYNGEVVPDDVRNRLLKRKKHLKVPKTRLLYKNIQDGKILSRQITGAVCSLIDINFILRS